MLKDAIEKSLKRAAVASFANLSTTISPGARPKVSYALRGNYKGAAIHFVMVSLRETTSIVRGENAGVTLTNENVVRQFSSAPATAAGEVSVNAPIPSKDNLAAVAYIRRPDDLSILGGASAELR